MPQGIQVFKDGVLQIDYTTPVGKLLGQFITNGSKTGSVSDSRISQGTFFYFGLGEGLYPTVTASGSSINWDYDYTVSGGAIPPTAAQMTHTVYYGIY